MTHDPDPRIAELLRRDAPPARDPMFRVAVLSRLERARFRRRRLALLALAFALAAVAALGAAAGETAREATGVLLVGAALTVGYFVLAPAMASLITRFRN